MTAGLNAACSLDVDSSALQIDARQAQVHYAQAFCMNAMLTALVFSGVAYVR